MDAWLSAARDELAASSGLPPEELELTPDMEATLLDLARIAAHDSGARTNAPLLSYLLGRASTRAELDGLAEAVRSIHSQPEPG